MRVISLPDFSLENPYQWLLARALDSRGVDMELSDGIGRFPVIGAVRTYGRPDVLHLHWTDPYITRRRVIRSGVAAASFVVQLLLVRASGTRVVWTVHDLVDHETRHPSLERVFRRMLVRFTDALIVHSRSARDTVVREMGIPRRLRERVHVIPHGHYLDAYPSDSTRDQARAELGLGEDIRAIVNLGRLRPYRGIEQLLDAFATLDSPTLRLILAGRIDEAGLRAQIDAHRERDPRILVRYGFVPDEDVQRYLLAADIVALPYTRVLTSGSALLALSFGRAVVAPRIGSLPEVLDEQGAVLYNPGDTDDLARALAAAVSSDLDAMGAHNARVAASLDWDTVAAQTLEVYGGETHEGEPLARRRPVTLPANPWRHRLERARRELDAVLGAGTPITLADDGELAYDLASDRPIAPFLERDGTDWGPPGSDGVACAELERLLASGARHLVVSWPSFWWFREFPDFTRRLRKSARCLLRTDRLVVFELPSTGNRQTWSGKGAQRQGRRPAASASDPSTRRVLNRG